MTEVRPKIQGSLVALVTPMTVDGCIDFEQLNRLVEWHIQQKTDGLVIMGTTGESSLVSDQELLEVVAKVIDVVKGRIPVIAGCGATSTKKAVDLAKQLAELKPDALLCVTPYYVKPEQKGLIAHYESIAESSEVGIILYNVPARTGCDLSSESVLELSTNKNIIGLKDATGELERVSSLIKQLPDDFALLSGDDETAYDFIALGGKGVISVTANVIPNKMAQWTNLAIAGELTTAKRVFGELESLHKVLFVESNPIPVKWALHLMDKITSGYRLPLLEPSTASKKLIRQRLEEHGLV